MDNLGSTVASLQTEVKYLKIIIPSACGFVALIILIFWNIERNKIGERVTAALNEHAVQKALEEIVNSKKASEKYVSEIISLKESAINNSSVIKDALVSTQDQVKKYSKNTTSLYLKLLMKSIYSNGSWSLFVTGMKGDSCTSICNSIPRPDGKGFLTGSCQATWCDGHTTKRTEPPINDPWFGYGCETTQTWCKPKCMCDLGGQGWPDKQFDFPAGVEPW